MGHINTKTNHIVQKWTNKNISKSVGFDPKFQHEMIKLFPGTQRKAAKLCLLRNLMADLRVCCTKIFISICWIHLMEAQRSSSKSLKGLG